jgi:zinc protease
VIRSVVAALACGAALALAAPGHAAAPAPADAGTPREVTLRNGARLLLVPDPRAAAVNVAVWVEAGVRHEREGQVGVSHLIEHLSARSAGGGARDGDDAYRRRIEAEGGSFASFTAADFTCYTATVPRTALETVLRLEASRFGFKPTAAMLERDRAVVREENRARARANPLEFGLQRLYAAAFPGHPYRWPALGLDTDLQTITVRDCEEYLRARYTPAHTLITVVGDFDPDQALALARRTFESVPGRAAKDAGPPIEPEPSGERRVVETGQIEVPLLMVGWRVPADGGGGDDAALDALSAVLSNGPESRLARRFASGRPAAYFARTGRDAQRDATMFWAAAAPAADTTAVEGALVGEIEKLAAEPVSGEELDRARRQLEVALLFGRQTTRDRSQALGTAAMVGGDWRLAERRLERLRALTPEDLKAAAARTLTAARRTVVWLTANPGAGPGGPGSRP